MQWPAEEKLTRLREFAEQTYRSSLLRATTMTLLVESAYMTCMCLSLSGENATKATSVLYSMTDVDAYYVTDLEEPTTSLENQQYLQ